MYEYLAKFISDLAIIGAVLFGVLFFLRALRELFSVPKRQLSFPGLSLWKEWFPHLPHLENPSPEKSLLRMSLLRCLVYYTSLWMIRFIDGKMSYGDVGAVFGTDTSLLEGLAYPIFLYISVRFAYTVLQYLLSQRDAYWGCLLILVLPFEILFGVSFSVPMMIVLLAGGILLCLRIRRTRGKETRPARIPLSNRALENIWILLSFAGLYILLFTRFFALK
ncbi:MAG: hypothetical protein II781_01085 [Clostridia bacterium]|nr:hypothetical protein [Clostridia bacterium]